MTTTTPEQMQLLTKTCPACDERKPWRDFYARDRWPDGTMRTPQSRCRTCTREDARKRMASPAAMAATAARARARRQDNGPAREKRLAARREYDRIWRESRGARPRPTRRIDDTIRLDVAPLADWITEQLANQPGLTIGHVATWFGVDDRLVRAWRDRTTKSVRLDQVDQAFARLGLPHLLNELWPLTDQETAAA